MLAQRLYEAGYITYMRTDSTNLSAEAVEACRSYISSDFGDYLPEIAQPLREQGGRPGGPRGDPALGRQRQAQTALQGMERDAERLYELIWRQFVACQMPPARTCRPR